MTNTFKIGDLVRCIDDSGMENVHKGDVYTVTKVALDWIYISPHGYCYLSRRFEHVSQTPLDNQDTPIDYSNTTTLEELPMEPPDAGICNIGNPTIPIIKALNGANGPGQQAIAKAGMDLTILLLKKNTDYGNSAMTPPILAPSMTAREAIQCRMSDKIRRLERLLAGNPAEVNESIEDSISDLGGYSILWLASED